MTDREKLRTALLCESERKAHRNGGTEISVLDIISLLEALGSEHQRVVHHKAVLTAA